MSKPVSVVLLCEDKQLSAFSRRFLKKHGLHKGQINEINRPPEGKKGGSRKQWVTDVYPQQLNIIRHRSGAVLIVCTDADELTVDRRIADLDEACKKRGVEPRKDNEPVVMVVPKWNIETWLSYLKGESFDEDIKDNSPRTRNTRNEKECKEQVQKLFDMCYKNQALLEPAPPSLKAACNEYKKVKQ